MRAINGMMVPLGALPAAARPRLQTPRGDRQPKLAVAVGFDYERVHLRLEFGDAGVRRCSTCS